MQYTRVLPIVLAIIVLGFNACKKEYERDSIFDEKSPKYVPPAPHSIGMANIDFVYENFRSNNKIDINEECVLVIRFLNTGTTTIYGANISISCPTLILSDVKGKTIDEIAPGQEVVLSNFTIDLSSQPEPSVGLHTINIRVVDLLNKTTTTSVQVEYYKSNVNLDINATFQEGSPDGKIRANETIRVYPKLKNIGTETCENIYLYYSDISIHQSSQYVSSVTSTFNPINYGRINPGIEKTLPSDYVAFKVASNTPIGTVIGIRFVFKEYFTNRTFIYQGLFPATQ